MRGKYPTCYTIFPVSILGKGQPGSLQLSLQTPVLLLPREESPATSRLCPLVVAHTWTPPLILGGGGGGGREGCRVSCNTKQACYH